MSKQAVKKLTLNDLSKEELIHIIKKNFFIDMVDVENQIYYYRSDKAFCLYQAAVKKSSAALKEHGDLLNPYAANNFIDVPTSVLIKAKAAWDSYTKYSAQSDKYYKESTKYFSNETD